MTVEIKEDMRWYAVYDVRDIEKDMGHFFRLLKMSKDTKYKFLTEDREKFFQD